MTLFTPPQNGARSGVVAAAAATVVGAAALAACAPVEEDGSATAAASEAGRQCFFARQISGYREAPDGPSGEERIYVDVGPRDTYMFETFAPCPSLDWSWQIAFDTRGPGTICDGLDVDLIALDPNLGPQRCPVRMIRKLGPEEEGAR